MIRGQPRAASIYLCPSLTRVDPTFLTTRVIHRSSTAAPTLPARVLSGRRSRSDILYSWSQVEYRVPHLTAAWYASRQFATHRNPSTTGRSLAASDLLHPPQPVSTGLGFFRVVPAKACAPFDSRGLVSGLRLFSHSTEGGESAYPEASSVDLAGRIQAKEGRLSRR